MAVVALNGIRFHSFHGYYAEEQSVGNDYEIDVLVYTVLDFESLDDDLDKTVNYEDIYDICKSEMDVPRRLIESVAHSILQRLKNEVDLEAIYTVRIKKLNPMLGGLVDHAMIEVEG